MYKCINVYKNILNLKSIMGVKGWTFYVINPFDAVIEQKTQNEYDKNYQISYKKFIEELCIPEPNVLFNCENDNLFTFYISTIGELDKIELEEKFNVIFLKSVFFRIKYKSIKKDLESYYNKYDLRIRNFYKTGDYIYLIIEKTYNE
jgi:hypothetical protein